MKKQDNKVKPLYDLTTNTNVINYKKNLSSLSADFRCSFNTKDLTVSAAYKGVDLEAIKLLREEGVKIGLFQPITIWPFPEEQLKEVVKGRDTLVVELNWGQLVYEVERVLKNNKVHSLLKMTGMAITPNEIIDKIKEIKNA